MGREVVSAPAVSITPSEKPAAAAPVRAPEAPKHSKKAAPVIERVGNSSPRREARIPVVMEHVPQKRARDKRKSPYVAEYDIGGYSKRLRRK